MKDLEKLPIIDSKLATKLADNKQNLANEMLELLIKELPKDVKEINELFSQKKYDELRQRLHKLHGALCYCGTPRLKEIVSLCEAQLKKNKINELNKLIDHLNKEVDLLLQNLSPIP